MIKNILLASIFTLCCVAVSAQSFNIGVRAGLNYGQFRGPLETEVKEEYGVSGGFHFGINYAQNLTDIFSVRLEVLYIQNGSKQSFGGEGTESFYVLPSQAGLITERGRLDYDLDISNAYISFPLTAHFDITRKWEVLGGVYLGMLVGPTATGIATFESTSRPDQIVFQQSLDYRYNSDQAREGQAIGRGPAILVDGVRVDLPRFAGAYYQYSSKRGNAINFLDYGLVFGVTYNINRGFYFGVRADFGLSDITNNDVDITRANVNSEGTFIYRDDKDTHFGIQTSFGFRF